jgi:hypothetical protein
MSLVGGMMLGLVAVDVGVDLNGRYEDAPLIISRLSNKSAAVS